MLVTKMFTLPSLASISSKSITMDLVPLLVTIQKSLILYFLFNLIRYRIKKKKL